MLLLHGLSKEGGGYRRGRQGWLDRREREEMRDRWMDLERKREKEGYVPY